MNVPKLIVLGGIIVSLAVSCKKNTLPSLPLSSITIVNAMPASNPIVNMFGSPAGQHFSDLLQLGYGSSQMYSQPPTANALLVRPITDTAFTVFQGKLPLVDGGIYSLFLAGDTTKPDTLLTKDNIPNINDSSAGVRFVNLSIGGKSLSINLVATPSTAEFSNLGYMRSTPFKTYPATPSIGGVYSFEIRDQASGDSLTTFTWSYSLFKSNTIVIAGSTDPASSTPLNVFQINNY